MASGLAKGTKARGKRIAFGDGTKIRWHPYAEQIFRYNPNVAPPGCEQDTDIEWIANYAGNRPYVKQINGKWAWQAVPAPIPGEIFFSSDELEYANQFGSNFIVIEPNVPKFKSYLFNKQWPFNRYVEVARKLAKSKEIIQFVYPAPHGPGTILSGARKAKTPSFRHALAVMARAALYIGPEGGLHHGAAALNIPAVVIFGGFIHPRVTGYSIHHNIFTGGHEGCGSLSKCSHCVNALEAISTQRVVEAAKGLLK